MLVWCSKLADDHQLSLWPPKKLPLYMTGQVSVFLLGGTSPLTQRLPFANLLHFWCYGCNLVSLNPCCRQVTAYVATISQPQLGNASGSILLRLEWQLGFGLAQCRTRLCVWIFTMLGVLLRCKHSYCHNHFHVTFLLYFCSRPVQKTSLEDTMAVTLDYSSEICDFHQVQKDPNSQEANRSICPFFFSPKDDHLVDHLSTKQIAVSGSRMPK